MDTYEKKYNEAQKWIESIYSELSHEQQMEAEAFFPELKESEDEKIRKEILELVRQSSEVLGKQNQNNMITWLEKQGEQKATDEVKPKFNVGDWISGYYTSYQVLSINNEGYVVEDIDGNKINILFENEKFHHLWTIKDAKDGDVVVVPSIEGSEHSEQIFIFKEIKNRDYVKNVVEYYCRVCDNEFYVNERGFMGYADDYFVPSTQEQQKLLFQKMKEAGYEWNSEKKELKKISQRIVSAEVKEALWSDKYEGLTDFERILADICIGWIGEEPGWKQYIKDNADVLLKIAIEKFNSVQDIPFEQKSAEWSEEDERERKRVVGLLEGWLSTFKETCYAEDCKCGIEWLESLRPQPKHEWSEEDNNNMQFIDAVLFYDKDIPEDRCMKLRNWLKSLKPHTEMVEALKTEYEKGRADTIAEMKSSWSEEDEKILNNLIDDIKVDDVLQYSEKQVVDWLKSLKERCCPQKHWKPTEEMLEALYRIIPQDVMEKSEDEILLDKLYQGLKYGRILSK